MINRFPDLRIDQVRFLHDFQELCQIGAYGKGGVHRPALSEAHLEARVWFAEKIKNHGLELRIDGAGNHSAYLDCGPIKIGTRN